jgi:hypothetical protein
VIRAAGIRSPGSPFLTFLAARHQLESLLAGRLRDRDQRAGRDQEPTAAYEDEANLRDLIAVSRWLLPGVEEPVAVVTELGISGGGQADAVAMLRNTAIAADGIAIGTLKPRDISRRYCDGGPRSVRFVLLCASAAS